MSRVSVAWPGVPLALLSAALFGISTPFAKLLLGIGVSPWLLAGLLYLGSGIGLGLVQMVRRLQGRAMAEAPLRRADLPWLALVVLSGGVAGPVLLMFGLAATSAASASLLLNLEGLATMAIAWLMFRENVDRRLLVGAAAILAGAVLLSWRGGPGGLGWGAVAIAGACVAWGIDNNLTRRLSAADPVQITLIKGLAAGIVNLALALAAGSALPSATTIGGAALVGFVGYGVSLVLFVLALRHLGAARTAAYFSAAPFVGALVAIAMFGEPVTWRLVGAGLLMAVGLYLHLAERHEHQHAHAALDHEHRHVHDEHHQHQHKPGDPPGEPHAHRHRHLPLVHGHPHYPDLHHRHGHTDGPMPARSGDHPMPQPVDPVVVSVVQHRLRAIVEEMGEAMLRTSYSQILNSSRDFSTAICDLDGHLIAQAEHVPIHVGALPFAARAVSEFFRGDIHKGDVFLLNDPYHGGNHLPDLTAFVPIFEGEQPRFWSINRAHQSDIGGATHGAYNASATDIWQEGIRITPLRLYDKGEVRRDVLQMIATNVRHPRDFRGDLAAMIGSAHAGERRFLALAGEFGWAVTHAAIAAVLDGAERQTRAVISQWPDGVYRGEALLDDDGRGNQDIHIRATVTKSGSDLKIDLSDSHEQVQSFINSSYANTYSAVVVALSFLIDPDTPKNDGTFRPIELIAKPGTIVWADEGLPLTLCTSHCGQEIIEAIVKALAPACPERAMAGWGRRFRIAIQGKDPRNDRPFLWHFFQGRPGGGASVAGDGWPGAGEWHSAGGIKFGSLEVTEARFPLFFKTHEFRPDSGGIGEFRGGPGGIVEMVVETAESAIGNTAGEGVRHGACGILGGADGMTHRYALHSGNEEPRAIRTKETGIVIRPGDRLVLESGGGGGWGAPAERDPAAIAADIENGFVSNDSLPRLRGRVRVGAASSRQNMRGGAGMRSQARHLRRDLTEAEQALWRELRRGALGWRFHRQFPIPPYIIDFACIEARLIVEADGGQHSTPGEHDRRDAALRRKGWRILRFWNNDILENRVAVLETIMTALGPWPSVYPHPNPPPQAGEGAMRTTRPSSPPPLAGEG